jgi:hypothetical protein
METKKYTTHPSIWSIIFVILLAIFLIDGDFSVAHLIICSLALVCILIMAIRCGLGWHAYVEISDKGVKMKGCAKRISGNKKETIDDIFIPWGNVEEINGGFNGPVLELKTGEKIKLTQQINIDSKTLRKAFEQYKLKPEQTQEPFEVVGVYGQESDSTSPNASEAS